MPSVGIANSTLYPHSLDAGSYGLCSAREIPPSPVRISIYLLLVAYDLNHLETLFECKPSPAVRPLNERSAVVCMDRAPTYGGNNICIRCSEAARGHLRDGRKGGRAAVRTSIIVAAVYPNTATAANAAAASFRQCDRNE